MKKKFYNQPEVLVARIALESMILSGSPTPTPTGDIEINDIPTDTQW